VNPASAENPSFPEIADALKRWAKSRAEPLVLDGEVVARRGQEPTGFQKLQGRIHLRTNVRRDRRPRSSCSICYATKDLRGRPFRERRAASKLFTPRLRSGRGARAPIIRISEVSCGDGRALYDRAPSGWEV
jgi:ATP-dependent DNA ligase